MAKENNAPKGFADITASCAKVVGYFHLQNNIPPVKRLYIKNTTDVPP